MDFFDVLDTESLIIQQQGQKISCFYEEGIKQPHPFRPAYSKLDRSQLPWISKRAPLEKTFRLLFSKGLL